jgi:hypothetical protein
MKSQNEAPVTLSVIVPVAMGRGPYTELFNWLSGIKFFDLEIILVLDEYASKGDEGFLSQLNAVASEQVMVVRGSFGAPGLTRNFGIDLAKGEWISFWDCDDIPNVDLFMNMIKQAEIESADIAIGSFTWRNFSDSSVILTQVNSKLISELTYSIGRWPGIWRFAFRRKLIKFKFTALKMAEDQIFLLENTILEKHIFVSRDVVYTYFSGHQSSQTSKPQNFFDLRDAMRITSKLLKRDLNNLSKRLIVSLWCQQFRSNLKYNGGRFRFFALTFALFQFLKSSVEFKLIFAKNLFGNAVHRASGYSGAKVIVPLTGGLGNQLFQMAAGLSVEGNSPVGLDPNIGAPRLNKLGEPEIASFLLPNNINFLPQRKTSNLLKKSSGYLLRMGVSPRGFEQNVLLKRIFQYLWNGVVIFTLKSFCYSVPGIGTGYFPLNSSRTKQLIYGYFQSYKWPLDSISRLREIRPRVLTRDLEAYFELARIETPLIVHVRLGDYRFETNFGIPSPDYYDKAIRQLWETGANKKIWLFSDEPLSALEFIPVQLKDYVRVIPEIDDSAAHTLEVMRHGMAYVIGNSTFAWWAAYLSHNLDAKVIAPKPWFKHGLSPNCLIPPGWSELSAYPD